MTQWTLFCDGWRFREAPLGTSYENALSGEFAPVEIPHDYMIYDVYGLYREGEGWYKRTLDHTPDGKRTILRFEGVYMESTVFVNGEAVFEWKYGYSTFEADITAALRDGKNEIVVRCVYQNPNTRWYSGAGIYRRVWLISAPESRIPSDGVYISTVKEDDGWKVYVDTEIIGEGDVALAICDKDGNILATANGTSAVMSVKEPRLWDPADPYLHTLKVQLIKDGTVIDEKEDRFGFRTIEFTTDKGFFINGRSYKLHGVCEHHDNGALGSAINANALRRKIRKLKSMGVNSIRTSHNMPAVELVELCDEMGIVIIDEAFDMWENYKTPYDYARFFKDWYKTDVKSWICRDRNHPCVIMWSLGNEIGDTTNERGLEVTKMLVEEVRKYDPRKNAAVTIGSNQMTSEWAQKCALEIDTVGYNYAERLYAEHHEKYPTYCIYGSETSSPVQSRGIYHFPYENKAVTHLDHQCSSLFNCTVSWGSLNSEQNITLDRAAEFCAGQYLWTGFDYIGEPTPYTTKNSFFGQLDTAGFPKDSYYAYRAEWTDGEKAPMVHITPSLWDFNDGEIIDVTVHSNAARSELYCNGELVGSFDHDHSVGSRKISEFYKVPYVKGCLSAIAYDKDGNVVARDEVKTCYDPAKIVLEPETETLNADGRDLIYLAISVADEFGTFVGNARSRMHVTVSGAGRLIGLDNGDSTDGEPYKGTSRRLFSGRLIAIIASNGKEGDIEVTVSSPELPTEKITLKALPAEMPVGIDIVGECSCSPEIHEIPLRKIGLEVIGSRKLTKEAPTAVIKSKKYPANATFDNFEYQAYFKGVPTDLVTLEKTEDGILATAHADGEFRILVSSDNGTPYPAICSDICLEAVGVAEPFINPYSTVAAVLAEESAENAEEPNGGIHYIADEAYSLFRDVDFGQYGADTLSVSLLRVLEKEITFRVYDVTKNGDELIGEFVFSPDRDWWMYSTNTYALDKKLTGLHDIKFVFRPSITFGSFSCTAINPAYSGISAANCDVIYGDDYEKREDGIYKIGNNVTVGFKSLDLTDGTSSITIKARTRNERDSIRLSIGEKIVTVAFSKNDTEVTFPVSVSGTVDCDLIFLPGCHFDLFAITFNK